VIDTQAEPLPDDSQEAAMEEEPIDKESDR
jgi:hypothetical protein